MAVICDGRHGCVLMLARYYDLVAVVGSEVLENWKCGEIAGKTCTRTRGFLEAKCDGAEQIGQVKRRVKRSSSG